MNAQRFMTTVLLAGLAAVLLIACQPIQPVQSGNVVEEYLNALVAKDLDAALGTVAEEVTHTDPHAPPGAPSLTQGKENLGEYLAGFLNDANYRIEYTDLQVEGDRATWATKEWFDADMMPPNFPLPIESHLQAEVADGKIKSILLENDPAWLEKLYATIPPEMIDPVSVTQLWTKAFNERNEEALRAVMADDITMKIVYGTPEDPMLAGKDEVLAVMQSSGEDNFTLELGMLLSDGTLVRGDYSGIGDGIRVLDIGPEVGVIEALVEDGVIKLLTFTPDAEFNQKYDEAMAES